MGSTFVSESSMKSAVTTVEGSFESIGGERFYRVGHFDAMAPFFMSLVSASDHWLFISSNGALTAGRRDPDHALFPYYTDDRIHDSQHQTGSKTILRVTAQGKTSLWEPFSQRYQGLYGLTRNLYKSVYGHRILFEEVNRELSLTFRYEWMSSDQFGFVRRCELVNDSPDPVVIDLLDGVQNVLPCGLDRRFQMEYSTLADGYKRTELLPDTGMALFCLSSIPVDKAEPSEALRANLAWSTGLEGAKRLLSANQFEAFRRGLPVSEETEIRGQRGAYMLNTTIRLEPGGSRGWMVVLEADQEASEVRALNRRLKAATDLQARVMADVDLGTRNLLRIVGSVDGLQSTGDEASCWRHFSNALFNVMRGGLPDDDYRISRDDLQAFLTASNQAVARKHTSFLASRPPVMALQDWKAQVAELGDPDLERLIHEYLPLTFSRRHGDPSRPWNIFAIQVKDERGRKILNYQGNWRDIFQNWEALGHAYPGFLESMITKFVDSSTADGYNPYRVLREGFEWETIDPHDAWSFIGYWGDHQIIYLLKLLEAAQRFQPGSLSALLGRRIFSYANVPYRIRPYQSLLDNPRSTITFDQEAHRQLLARAAAMGADGKLLAGPQGTVRATLAEKLLLMVLTKLSNFIPEAGIWMNTQRPEWNDANNALVGYGVSMVTLCYLRRFLAFCRDLFAVAGSDALEVSTELGELFRAMSATLQTHVPSADAPLSTQARKATLDALGKAGSHYRESIYGQGFSGATTSLTRDQLLAFCDLVLLHLDHSIRVNRRADGLYHAYNLMKVVGDGIEVRPLQLMLEGQVAVLSSGTLGAGAAADLLDALRQSSLYREDQGSYLLYPDRTLPHFLDKNNLPEASVAASELLSTMLQAGDERLVHRDVEGLVHFHASFRNGELLREALQSLADGDYQALAAREGDQILALYEAVFDHQSFTGRSGTFFKYEGLGCIYWHMVSKLLLAVDEVRRAAPASEPANLARLNAHYQALREGIGVHKSPAAYGAIPTDPYSHTPGFAGAQQPGMTGQVKEDLLTRLSELGLVVTEGCLSFRPHLIPESEFLLEPGSLQVIGRDGEVERLELGRGTFGFTFGQVPVIVHRSGAEPRMVATLASSAKTFAGLTLDAELSAAIFAHQGRVRRLDVFLGS